MRDKKDLSREAKRMQNRESSGEGRMGEIHTSGFTLIELLVVIAIIAILDIFAWYFLPTVGFVLAIIATALIVVVFFKAIWGTKFIK